MKEFFQHLKELREEKKITLEDISRKSRLALKYLIAIEAGELDKLPRGYDRIFFKRYLKEIGEDKPDVWRDFNLFFGAGPYENNLPYSSDIPVENSRETLKEAPPENEPEAEKKPSFFQELPLKLNMDKLYRYFWIAVSVVVLGVVGYFAYKQYVFVKSSQFEIKEVSVTEFIQEMQKQDSLMTSPLTQSSSVGAESSGTIRVELKARERTWVREIRDRTDTTDYIMPAGFNRGIEAKQAVQFILGRADGVEIWLNGENLGVMGGSDEIVVRLVLTEEGIMEKRLKKVTPDPSTTPTTTNEQ
ncbi:MAG: hypothetical protein Kow0042_00960 [Calditrichia bacterium]